MNFQGFSLEILRNFNVRQIVDGIQGFFYITIISENPGLHPILYITIDSDFLISLAFGIELCLFMTP